MRLLNPVRLMLSLCLAGMVTNLPAALKTVYETTSAYHHIRVWDEAGYRMLSFDNSRETRMQVSDPLKGHFEYTEYFHLPWLWNEKIEKVLMIGLGGGSVPKAWQQDYPNVQMDVVELDPMVVQVAQKFFHVKPSSTLRLLVSDGRLFLRRSQATYDVIMMDAYVYSRYGSSIPFSLATKEFFAQAHSRLSEQGVLVYNVIGNMRTRGSDALGAIYRTLKTVFPQVYLFPAASSQNVVLVATKSKEPATPASLQQKLAELRQKNKVQLPTFEVRLNQLTTNAPASAAFSPILTDDFAPVDNLLRAMP